MSKDNIELLRGVVKNAKLLGKSDDDIRVVLKKYNLAPSSIEVLLKESLPKAENKVPDFNNLPDFDDDFNDNFAYKESAFFEPLADDVTSKYHVSDDYSLKADSPKKPISNSLPLFEPVDDVGFDDTSSNIQGSSNIVKSNPLETSNNPKNDNNTTNNDNNNNNNKNKDADNDTKESSASKVDVDNSKVKSVESKVVSSSNNTPLEQINSVSKDNSKVKGSDKSSESNKKSEVFSRDEDVFSPEEFENLEKKEEGLFSKIFKKGSKSDEGDDSKAKADDFDILSQRQISRDISRLKKNLENENIANAKLSGKLDILNQKNEDISEQIQNLVEKIGELRSTVLGRERMFNKLEDDFNSVKYIVNTFKPDNLEKQFRNIETQLVKLGSSLEKNEAKTRLNEDKLSEFIKLIEKIKSFENVLNELENVKATEAKIKKMKLDIDKSTSKTELIVQNVSESVAKINKTSIAVESNSDAIKDIMLSLAKIESRLDFLVKQEDFDYLNEDLKIIKKVLFEKDFKNQS